MKKQKANEMQPAETPEVSQTPTETPEVSQTPAETPEAPEVLEAYGRYRVAYPHGLNLRDAPGGNIVRVLPFRGVVEGEEIVVLKDGSEWLRTSEGFANAAYLRPEV